MISQVKVFVSIVVYIPRMGGSVALESLPSVLKEVNQHFEQSETIIVNDTGVALSPEERDKLRKAGRNISLIELPFNHGLERAMTAGSEASVGDFIFEIDYPIKDIRAGLLQDAYQKCVEENVDVLSIRGTGALPLSSKAFYAFLNMLGVTDKKLTTEHIRVVSRRALNRVLKERRFLRMRKLMYSLSAFKTEALIDNGLETVNSASLGDRFSQAIDLLVGTSRLASSFSRFLAGMLGCLCILMIAYTLVIYVLGYPVSEGWGTMMIFVAFGFSGIFGILSLISGQLEILIRETQELDPYMASPPERLDNN